jgi:hypothetical protein
MKKDLNSIEFIFWCWIFLFLFYVDKYLVE